MKTKLFRFVGAQIITFLLMACLQSGHLLFSAGCGGSGGSGGDSGSTETGTVTGDLSLADDVTLALRKGRLPNVQTPSGIRVYIDGDDSLYGDTDSSGNFTIENVPVGRNCIRASAEAISNMTYGFRKCFDVTSDGTDAGTVEMEEAGSLSGDVALENASDDYEGVLIYAAGTSYDAHTDSSGAFAISDMPPGEYDVTISMDGYMTYKYTSVFIYAGLETVLADVTLPETASCTEGGAVLAVTSVTQSADTIDIGDSVTFSVEACSSLFEESDIGYYWYDYGEYSGYRDCENTVDDAVGTESSYTFTSDESNGGDTHVFCVRAEIDSNNLETVSFYVRIPNNDYFTHVGRSETQVPPLAQISGAGKYGDYLYILGTSYDTWESGSWSWGSSSDEIVEIVDVADPENPEYVDSLDYTSSEDEYAGMIIEGSNLFVQICEADGTHIYMYDLSGDPASPSLLNTLTGEDLGEIDQCLHSSDMIFDGQYLYVNGGIVDFATPSSPVLKSTPYMSPLAYYSNYLVTGSFSVWDVSDRSSPSLTTTYTGDWGEDGPTGISYSDSSKIYVPYDSYSLDVLDITALPTITSIQTFEIQSLEGINEERCSGNCSGYINVHNVGDYTLLYANERGWSGSSSSRHQPMDNEISVFDADDLETPLGDIHSYVTYFAPDLYNVLSDDDYIYFVHTDGVDIYRAP